MSELGRYQPIPEVRIQHPEWSKNATIYQINTRQFTAEGTFRAAEAHLPRLKALGVDILWLMPVHPIGEQNRKGSLGSPYAVKDYYAVNPEFGSLDDLKHFVQAAHSLGLHVILDWVANHTAWDNVLAQQHPEWYARDWKGDFRPTPWWDWPSSTRMKAPEMPGRIMAQMASAPLRNSRSGVWGISCGVTPTSQYMAAAKANSMTTAAGVQRRTRFSTTRIEATISPKKNPHTRVS